MASHDSVFLRGEHCGKVELAGNPIGSAGEQMRWHSPHHYTFVLIATDFEPKDMPPALTRDEVVAKFGPPPMHLKGASGLVGLFVNPWHN